MPPEVALAEVVCKEVDPSVLTTAVVAIGDSTDQELFLKLPPMPTPNHKVKRWQATGGCVLVTGLILFFAASAHSVSQASNLGGWYVPVSVVWAEALLAFGCLLALMFANPGVVERSLRNSMPLPPEIREKLIKGESLDGLANARGTGGRIFCVRCFGAAARHLPYTHRIPTSASDLLSCVGMLSWHVFNSHHLATTLLAAPSAAVWRPGTPQSLNPAVCFGLPMQTSCNKKPVHHCSVCQRCVTDFDHHCGVFGRCIASGAQTASSERQPSPPP